MPPKTRSYQEYLIETLGDPQEAALYLWAILQEENPEPELLFQTFSKGEKLVEQLGIQRMIDFPWFWKIRRRVQKKVKVLFVRLERRTK